MLSAFSAKMRDNEIVVLDDLKLDSPSTTNMVNILNNIKIADKKVLVVTSDVNENVVRSTRNVPGVQTTFVGEINVYDILNHDIFLATQAAIEKIEEVYNR